MSADKQPTSPTSGGGAAPAASAIAKCKAKDIKKLNELIKTGKKGEAIEKACSILKSLGFNLSSMKNGKPIYDASLKTEYGVTPRQKEPEVRVGEAAFTDASTLLTTIAHENKHAQQWSDPDSARKMGSDARELEAYFVEIKNEKLSGVDKNMRNLNRTMAEKHYKNLSSVQKQKYKLEYERIVGPVPK